MAQVKKAEVREAILRSAYRLFKKKGYLATTTVAISAGAKISESNLYNYFESKFEILFELYTPWLRERLEKLEKQVAQEQNAKERVRLVLHALWVELPRDDNGFTNNLMQALSAVARAEGYRPDLLTWAEERIQSMILAAVPKRRRAKLVAGNLAKVLMMAQDGFSMNFHLNPAKPCDESAIDVWSDLIMGLAV
jgi:AcrR family transcriptional regulator